jgi:hypothetical protein
MANLGSLRQLTIIVNTQGELAPVHTVTEEQRRVAYEYAQPKKEEYFQRLDALTEVFLRDHFGNKNYSTSSLILSLPNTMELGEMCSTLFDDLLKWVHSWADLRVVYERA